MVTMLFCTKWNRASHVGSHPNSEMLVELRLSQIFNLIRMFSCPHRPGICDRITTRVFP